MCKLGDMVELKFRNDCSRFVEIVAITTQHYVVKDCYDCEMLVKHSDIDYHRLKDIKIGEKFKFDGMLYIKPRIITHLISNSEIIVVRLHDMALVHFASDTTIVEPYSD